MPNLDRTGQRGKGPMTGRGMGYRDMPPAKKKKKPWWLRAAEWAADSIQGLNRSGSGQTKESSVTEYPKRRFGEKRTEQGIPKRYRRDWMKKK